MFKFLIYLAAVAIGEVDKVFDSDDCVLDREIEVDAQLTIYCGNFRRSYEDANRFCSELHRSTNKNWFLIGKNIEKVRSCRGSLSNRWTSLHQLLVPKDTHSNVWYDANPLTPMQGYSTQLVWDHGLPNGSGPYVISVGADGLFQDHANDDDQQMVVCCEEDRMTYTNPRSMQFSPDWPMKVTALRNVQGSNFDGLHSEVIAKTLIECITLYVSEFGSKVYVVH